MGHQRRRASIALVALIALALPLLTAADTVEDETEGVGDARASLIGALLEVEDLDGVTAGLVGGLLGDLDALAPLDTRLELGLLEGETSATTRDGADARAGLTPVRIGSERPYDVEAEPGERETGETIALGDVSALLSGVSVTPFAVAADADDEGAIGIIEAVTASADVLGDGGIDVGLTEVVSEVTPTWSSADQDLVVDGLSLSLGDILPEELLAALPLDALLDLLEELDALGLIDGVGDLRGALEGAVGDVRDLIEQIAALDLEVLDDLDPALLRELLDLQDAEETLEEMLGDLDGAEDELLDLLGLLGEGGLGDLTGDSTLDDILDAIAGLEEDGGDLVDDVLDEGDDLLDDVGDTVGGIVGAEVSAQAVETIEAELLAIQGGLEGLAADLDLDAGLIADCTGGLADSPLGLLDDVEALQACVEDVLDVVTGLIDDLTATITAQLGGIDDLLDLLLGLLDELEDALGVLLDLVDEILGNVGAVAGLELLSAESVELFVAAAADAEDGYTLIECELGGLSVLGESLGEASCDDGELTGPALGAVAEALGVVEDVLTALPGVTSVDGLRLELLPEANESVVHEDDGTVIASASAVLLELAVPSVTIDPTELADDLLDLPALPGSLTGLLGIEGELDGVLSLLDQTGLDAVLGEAEGLLDGVGDVLAEVTALLGAIDLLVLDEEISTPSIDLGMGPTSEATFTAAEVEEPTPVDEEPTTPTTDAPTTGAPTTPGPDRDLPVTGGAFGLLGLLALAGAAALRRTG